LLLEIKRDVDHQINHKRLRGRRCMDAPRSSPA
jgi:hypothetical protein